MELYIHIPFCIKKCKYCDFLSAPADETTQERYFNALISQIKAFGEREQKRTEGSRTVTSVFIGGGTPSVWEADRIAAIMNTIKTSFKLEPDAEISIEANPGTLSPEKLAGYLACGINRLSLGLQSSDGVLLKALGRIHTYEDFEKNYQAARDAGFKNINVDIMSGLPGQSLATFEKTLDAVISLAPEHISCYSLIVEEGTPFYEMNLDLPDEDTEREMYHLTKRKLEEAGYHRYEISNYAKEGYECRHNLGYWSDAEYIGIGLGAASLDDNVRYSIIQDLTEYLEIMESEDTPERKLYKLITGAATRTEKDCMEEFCFLGLRKTAGISRREFKARFGRSIDIVYEDAVRKYLMLELLESDGDALRLSEKGIDVSNTVMAEFLLDEENL